MAHIREIIEALCEILNTRGASEVKAESFRQAKRNKVQACAQFWRLLYEVIFFIEKGRFPQAQSVKSDYCNYFVVHTMNKYGYRLQGFASDVSTEEHLVSRDLLLAFGWLIAEFDVIDRLVQSMKPVLVENPVIPDTCHSAFELPCATMNLPRMKDQVSYIETELQNLVVLKGKLRACLKSLLSREMEYLNLLHKVHRCTQQPSQQQQQQQAQQQSKHHLSILEVYLLKHPNKMVDHLNFVESQVRLLKSYILWQENKGIFWKWMESVLDAKLEELGPQNTESTAQSMESFDLSALLRQLEHMNKDLSELFSSQSPLFFLIEDILHRSNNNGLKEDSDYSSICLASPSKLIYPQNGLESLRKETRHCDFKNDRTCSSSLPETAKFIGQTKSPKKIKHDILESKAFLETQRILDLLNKAKDDLLTLKILHVKQMTNLTQELKNAVCIPPPRSRKEKC